MLPNHVALLLTALVSNMLLSKLAESGALGIINKLYAARMRSATSVSTTLEGVAHGFYSLLCGGQIPSPQAVINMQKEIEKEYGI